MEMIVRGKISDRKTGEAMPFANVYASDSKGKNLGQGVMSDANGNFSFDIKNAYYVTASFVGYGKDTVAVKDMKCTVMGCEHDFRMKSGITLPEVTKMPTWWQNNWKKVVGWGIVATGVTVIGYFAYQKFGKK